MREGDRKRRGQGRSVRARQWAAFALTFGAWGAPGSARAEEGVFTISAGLTWQSPGSEVALLRGNGKLTGNYETDLRDLESDLRPSASRRLVELSGQHTVLNNPTWRLSLIRALARHERHRTRVESIRLEILRALISLVDAEETITEDGTVLDLERGAWRHLARGTAAMALARSRHPLALKKLLALALGGDQMDPVGAQVALSALRSLPKSALQTKELLRLFPAEAIRKISDPDSVLELPHFHGTRVSTEAFTPKTLVLASKGSEPAPTKPRTESTISESSADFLSFEAMIALLHQEASLPRTFAHVKSWEQALKEDPAWTLRALALLGTQLEAPVLAWGKRTALAATRATSKVERSAGAWCSAALAPDSVRELLARNDPVITRAVLRQASDGEVSQTVAAFLHQDRLKGDEKNLALSMVLQDPNRWPEFSTSFLRAQEEEHSGAGRAALSSRLRAQGPGLGPDVESVRNWLNSATPEVRGAVAFGLGEAPSGPAQGLLFWAYRKESHPQTRRAIVASIEKTPLAKNPDFRELLAIDPDERCRAFLSGGAKSKGLGMHIGWASRRTTEVTDGEGRILEVAPAPDGFVGIVRSSF